MRALGGFYRRRARHAGIPDVETGAVTAIQRFGSGVNLNVHYHTLALDGVFAPHGDGGWRFVPAPPPAPRELARLVTTIAHRVERVLARQGRALGNADADAGDPLAENAPALAALCAASVAGRSPSSDTRLARASHGSAAVGDAQWQTMLANFYTLAIASAVRDLGLAIRAGVHTGECEVGADDVAGLAVHIAARVAGTAAAGEVIVSSTVKDLVAGSGLVFADRGTHVLRGIPDEWRLFAAGIAAS